MYEKFIKEIMLTFSEKGYVKEMVEDVFFDNAYGHLHLKLGTVIDNKENKRLVPFSSNLTFAFFIPNDEKQNFIKEFKFFLEEDNQKTLDNL